MRLREIYNQNKPAISFEIFPPDSDEKIEKLYQELEILKNYNPQFISLTCGAAGKNNENSRKVLKALKENFNFEIMPHFTCICNKKEFTEDNLNFIKTLGSENILALRGDIPEGYEQSCSDFCHANELVEYLKCNTDFSIAVAGYPEGHIESESLQDDLKYLKLKTDAGADAIITQMFFDNEKFYSYAEKVCAMGIEIPIIPGIMPIISAKQLDKMRKLANITLPKNLAEKIEKHAEDSDYIKKLGIDFASEQCCDLLENGVRGLQFFTLNKAFSSAKILENLNR